MEIVMPRAFSSGALSIWSNADASLRFGYLSCRTLVIAAVSVVFPWSMCPMVPMLTCGLVRSNLALATGFLSPCLSQSCACLGGAGRAQVMAGLLARDLGGAHCSVPEELRSSGRGRPCDAHSPVTFAMISLATFEGTSAYESNTMV